MMTSGENANLSLKVAVPEVSVKQVLQMPFKALSGIEPSMDIDSKGDEKQKGTQLVTQWQTRRQSG